MNNQSKTTALFSYFLTLTFAMLILIPMSYADDDDKGQYMGMGYGHMGYGHMGYGHMASGPMGYGHMGYNHMGSEHMGMGYNFINRLDLSSEQRTTIRNIRKEMRSKHIDLHDKIGALNEELYSLYKEEKPDAKKVGAVYKKIFNLKQQQIESSVTTKNKIYDVLNKNQKEKLKELKSSLTDCGMSNRMHGRGMPHMME